MLGQLIDRKTDLGGKVEFYVGDVKSSLRRRVKSEAGYSSSEFRGEF